MEYQVDNMDRDDQISLAAFDPLAQPAVRLLVETIDTAFVEKVREKMVMADRPTTYRRNGKRTLVLLYAGRSGSTYAAELLSNHPSLGRMHEWFSYRAIEKYRKRHGLADHNACLQHILDNQAGDIFACKSIPMSIAGAALLGYLDQFREGLHFVHLRRRDTTAQAVSIFKGRLTGHYHSTDGGQGGVDRDAFDYDRIVQHRQVVQNVHDRHERILAAFGNAATTYYYEDMVADPMAFFAAVTSELGLTVPEGLTLETRLRKVGDSINKDWIARVREIDAAHASA